MAATSWRSRCWTASSGRPRAALGAVLLLLAGALAAGGDRAAAAGDDAPAALARGEWPAYAGTYASLKYSPLAQIDGTNAGALTIAWRWASPDQSVRAANPRVEPSPFHESTPLMVGGVLYTSTSLSQVAAIDAATGRTRWLFDPGDWKYGRPPNMGWVHRGVAYWRDGADARIVLVSSHAALVALDARTGRPVETFGNRGWVDLREGLGGPVPHRGHYGNTSPPVIVRDVIVVGSTVQDLAGLRNVPRGDVRGFDVRTGRKLWTFRPVPEPGEAGHETWGNDSWKTTGGANVWTLMSGDEDLGHVYLPFSTPGNDHYGGQRPGDNLFGDTLVCLDARTGRRIWHHQLVRHGLWDYDLPAAPSLVDLTVGGQPIKAVAQVTKQGFVFVFDRVTGHPVWPIEDRPAPASRAPGEQAAATQLAPTKPAPFEIQGVREEDLLDFTPELRRAALDIVRRYDHGPLFTPPSERGAIVMPGVLGGANWAGAAWDPESQTYFVTTVRQPHVITIERARGASRDAYGGRRQLLRGPQGWPLFKPPWGSVVAIDLSTGEHRWREAVGAGPRPQPLPGVPARLGTPARSFALATKTVLLVAQAKLYAFDKASGALLAEVPLPATANGAPMTYTTGGKQYVVLPVGGESQPEELIALAPP